MLTKEEDPLLALVKELDRLYETQPDEVIRELLWALISDVQGYRRNKRGAEKEKSQVVLLLGFVHHAQVSENE